MTSRPLFISVAESIVILPPIAQVGCCSACSTVTSSSSARVRPRNGPPDAVTTSRSTVPVRSPAISWCRAECSESTGISCAPVASASAVTSSPPTTSDSLLASATSMPSVSATIVGPRPAEPTIALSTRSAPDSATSRTRPSGPASTSPPVHDSAARAAASGSDSAIRRTPWAARLLDERLVGGAGGQPDQLELARGALDDVEGLRADGARGAEDEQPPHGSPLWQGSAQRRISRAGRRARQPRDLAGEVRLVGVARLERGAGEVVARAGEEAAEAQHALERLRAVADRGVEAAPQLALGEADLGGQRVDAGAGVAQPRDRGRHGGIGGRGRELARHALEHRRRLARRRARRAARAASTGSSSARSTRRSRSSLSGSPSAAPPAPGRKRMPEQHRSRARCPRRPARCPAPPRTRPGPARQIRSEQASGSTSVRSPSSPATRTHRQSSAPCAGRSRYPGRGALTAAPARRSSRRRA